MELNLLNLCLVLLAGWLAGSVSSRLGYPAVLGELLAGIVLGPPVLGWFSGGSAFGAVHVLADLGVLLMMLYIGMEIDAHEVAKASWAGLLAAVGCFAVPFVPTYFVAVGWGESASTGLALATVVGVSSVMVSSRILVDLRLLDTRIAHVLLAGALISDVLGLVAFAALQGFAKGQTLAIGAIAAIVGKATLFFVVTTAVGIKLYPWVGQRLAARGALGRKPTLTVIVLVALAFGELAEHAGLHRILGAFAAGLFLREGVLERRLLRDLTGMVHDVAFGFLAPVFFVLLGFRVTFSVFSESPGLLVTLIVVATLAKLAGAVVFYLPTRHGWREGLTVGVGMNGRGGVDVIIAGLALEAGLMSAGAFSGVVFLAILTMLTVPVGLKLGVAWLRRRGELARTEDKRRGVLVVGASPAARTLASALGGSEPVWVIDNNPARCAAATAEGLTAVCGNALDREQLGSAHAAGARTLVAMTANAEVNALTARLAREQFLVPEVYLVVHGRQGTGSGATLEHLDASALFGQPVQLATWDVWLEQGQATIERLPVAEETEAVVLAQALNASTPTLPLAVTVAGRTVPFHARMRLPAGSTVVVARTREAAQPREDRFDRLVRACPVLDLDGATSSLEGLVERLAPELGAAVALGAEVVLPSLRRWVDEGGATIAPGLAVPHVTVPGEGRYGLVAVRLRGAPEVAGVPLRTVLALASTSDERRFHLQALAAISQVVQQPEFERRWQEAATAEDLRALLLAAPRRRFA